MQTTSFLQKYPLIGFTHLTLTDTGLRVQQRRFFSLTDGEIPFEQLMPLSFARQRSITIRPLLAALFVLFGCLKSTYVIFTDPLHRESAAWLLLILAGIEATLLVVLVRTWKYNVLLSTDRGHIPLFDSRKNRPALLAFTEMVRTRTTHYLVAKYAAVNPLLPAQPQLEKLEWLHELNVISTTQFHQFKTRLLGLFYNEEALPGEQEGFTPSVN